jgi:hypothetical protein
MAILESLEEQVSRKDRKAAINRPFILCAKNLVPCNRRLLQTPEELVLSTKSRQKLLFLA